jgi:hypothetical protein
MAKLLKGKGGRPRKTDDDRGVNITVRLPVWMVNWVDRRGRRSDDIRLAICVHMGTKLLFEYDVKSKMLDWAREKAKTEERAVRIYPIGEVFNELCDTMKFDDSINDGMRKIVLLEAADRLEGETHALGMADRINDGGIGELGIWIKRDLLRGSKATEKSTDFYVDQ